MSLSQTSGPGAWTTRRVLGLLGNVVLWLVVAVDAWFLWPTSLGGQTSLVIVSGSSMEPTYFSGDLVIARAMEPSVGDVIVYAPEGYGGSQIVHRIIGGNGQDGWVVQGDNNSFVDPFEPTNDEVKGVVLVHYANMGRVTALLLNPLLWAGFLLAAAVILIWDSGNDDDEDEDDEDAENSDHDAKDDADAEPSVIVEKARDAAAAVGASFVALVSRIRQIGWSWLRPAWLVRRGVATSLALLGLVAVAAVTPASASHLEVVTGSGPTAIEALPCASSAWTATTAGTPSGGNYSQVALGGIPAPCRNMPASVYLYNASGALLTSATVTPTGATATISTSAYAAANVSRVVVKVNGWVLRATWTPPTPPVTTLTCVAVNSAGVPTGQSCTVTVNGYSSWGMSPNRIGNFYFNGSSPSSHVILTLNVQTYMGFVPTVVRPTQTSTRAPGYSCSQLPVVSVMMPVQNFNNGSTFWGGFDFYENPSNASGGAVCPAP